jgi:DNA-binding phage protein
MDDMSKTPRPDKPSEVLIKIRKEAQKQGLTAYAIAKSTGLGINTIQRMLDGVVSPSLTTLEAVAKALGMVVKIEKA